MAKDCACFKHGRLDDVHVLPERVPVDARDIALGKLVASVVHALVLADWLDGVVAPLDPGLPLGAEGLWVDPGLPRLTLCVLPIDENNVKIKFQFLIYLLYEIGYDFSLAEARRDSA